VEAPADHPSEIILLPNWLYFNIYEMSSWSRGMVVPLSILNHFKPVRNLPPEKQLHELFPTAPSTQPRPPFDKKLFTWKNFFLGWNSVLKFLDTLPWKPFRVRAAEEGRGVDSRTHRTGFRRLGAISQHAVHDHGAEDARLRRGQPGHAQGAAGLPRLRGARRGERRVPHAAVPLAHLDSAITAFALVESGVPADHPQIQKPASGSSPRK